MKLWTIAILTVEGRETFYERLRSILDPQIENKPIDVLVLKDNRVLSIGYKRQKALDLCLTPYISFIDDDDVISSKYVDLILKELGKRPYGVGFRGIITSKNLHPMEFVHKAGLKYSEKPVKYNGSYIYTRPLNHLNPVMIDVAREIGYLDISMGEDMDYANRLAASGLIKDEVFIDEFIYYYQYRGVNKI